MQPRFIVALCAAAAALAVSTARAELVTLSAFGDVEVVSSSGSETVYAFALDVLEQTGGFAFATVEVELVRTITPFGEDDLVSGLFRFKGFDPASRLDLTCAGTFLDPGTPLVDDKLILGTWEAVSGDGAYVSLTGTGAFTGFAIFYSTESGLARLRFDGDLVPAPGAAVLLGLLAFGRAGGRRRRR